MQIMKRKQCRVIREKDTKSFEEQYTTVLNSLQGNVDVKVQYSDGEFVAIFMYEQTYLPEERTIADEFHDEGIRYVCSQCPHLEIDGDKRKKRHPCKYAEYGSSRIDSECCEMFYKLLKQGRIVPKIGGAK